MNKCECGKEINGQTSDGYHTFDELYDHRQTLFCALMNAYPDMSWKSRLHDDGTMFDGDWFIAGVETSRGQATYHLEGRFWWGARVREFENAPKWDGHTAEDVLERLKSLSV